MLIQEDIKNLKWLEIFLWYTCNLKCFFCYQKNLRKEYTKNIEKKEIIKLLEDWYNNWKRFIIFSWWEPTLDINLSYYIEYSKKLWFIHIRVHTNWFWFINFDYLKDLYNKWLSWVTISIHWYNNIHDNITWKLWSFDIIKKALINFEALKKINNNFIFDINTVVCTFNYQSLTSIIAFLSKFNFTRLQLVIAYSLWNFSIKEKKEIIPEYQVVIPYIIKSLILWNYYNKKIVIENIPFCLINRKYWKNILDRIFIIRDSITVNEKYDEFLDDFNKTKLDECADCKLNNICKGITKDYKDVYENFTLKPIYE